MISGFEICLLDPISPTAFTTLWTKRDLTVRDVKSKRDVVGSPQSSQLSPPRPKAVDMPKHARRKLFHCELFRSLVCGGRRRHRNTGNLGRIAGVSNGPGELLLESHGDNVPQGFARFTATVMRILRPDWSLGRGTFHRRILGFRCLSPMQPR